ncbi:MAG: hypothetical protein ACFFAN_21060 [Promethearchaeota archaeon]
MTRTSIIVKIGGKILENSEDLKATLTQFKELLSQKRIQKIIIIPGGGSYANFVRKLDLKLNVEDDLVHWMAILAMDQNGIFLSQQYKEIDCIKNIDDLKNSNCDISVFLPYEFLSQNDELPHSWDVTSDSIALYIASQLGIDECLLIKDIDGIFTIENEFLREISAKEYKKLKNSNKLSFFRQNDEELKHSKPIDSYLTKLIDKYKIPCVILNGTTKNKRIIDYFDESINDQEKIYTKIINTR